MSAKSRHAVAAMIDLGLKSVVRPVALVDILDDHHISLSYLEQIFSRLKEHGLVEGIRGPRGGYRLARSPESITVAQIVRAVEDASYRGRKSRVTGKKSDAHVLWDILSTDIMAYLGEISVKDFMLRASDRTLPVQTLRRYEDFFSGRRAA
ncbi:MAG: Rrf2 family transcriptional regulator [Gammaproteobacteria bacterium]|nr:Rrf2 family transcriptional regulator [Gammaproteobacteria bacterium]